MHCIERTGERILEKRMKKQLKENLAMLKDFLEGRPVSRLNGSA
jgi:hypothetical protein